MKLRFLIFLTLFKYLIAQDVEIPGDLLTPKDTTSAPDDYENIGEIEVTTLEPATTIQTIIEDPTEGSWNFIPKSDNLIDDKFSFNVDPQQLNEYPLFDINELLLNFDQPPCNNKQPQMPQPLPSFINTQWPQLPREGPVIVPPIFDSKTEQPIVEEVTKCPLGFIKNGTTCIPLNANKCPYGYEWKENRCVLSKIKCPMNFELIGTSCVEKQVCPPTYELKNGLCIAQEPECMSGWQWNGEKCEIIELKCPPAFVLRGRECILEKVTCPPGFQFIDDQCVEPNSVCPPGFELRGSGFCSKISKRCPPGTNLVNGVCQKTEESCPPGYEKIDNFCYQVIERHPIDPPEQLTTTPKSNVRPPIFNPPQVNPPIFIDIPATPLPPQQTTERILLPNPNACPNNYVYHNSQCYKCPPGYYLCNGVCVRQIARCQGEIVPQYPRPINPLPPNNNYPAPNVNVHIQSKPIHVINNVDPVNNTIYNINNVTHPIELNNVNENNIYVYTETVCADGTRRMKIVKNNVTIMGCDDPVNPNAEETTVKGPVKDSEDNDEENQKCCEIVTPRRCKKRFTSQWMCTHRRYKHCGDICIARRLYVRPPATTWANQVLTIAPPPVQTYVKPCFGQDCPPVDCTGCIDGSYNCSPQCYTYPCSGNGCSYVDQDQICNDGNDREFCER